MSEAVRFVLRMSKDDLMDLAQSFSAGELAGNVSAAELAPFLREAISEAIGELLGDEVHIEVTAA